MVAPPAEELVGRTAELAAVDEALAALERGRALALAVIGEPGIGKTSLLAALDARAEERGHLVLSGGASELERDLPFGVFADALDDYVQALEPRRSSSSRPTHGRARRGAAVARRRRRARRAAGPPLPHASRRAAAARGARRAQAARARARRPALGRQRLDRAARRRAARPPAAPVLIALAARPRRRRRGCRRRWSARAARAS